jgi:hypothetical protein
MNKKSWNKTCIEIIYIYIYSWNLRKAKTQPKQEMLFEYQGPTL